MVKKVLVVDDELPIAQICKRVLMEEEYSVDTAKDGIEGKCCRSTIMSVVDCSGIMSVDGRTDIDDKGTE